jgi:hypothetical protein
MKHYNLTPCIKWFVVTTVMFFGLQLNAQKKTPRWRSAPVEALSVDTIIVDSALISLPFKAGRGELVINMDSAITSIDEIASRSVKTLMGYRIQIHFGDLESSRAVRAKCRREMNDRGVYLESIAPNYSVAVGDYRTRWEGEVDLSALKRKYPDALLVPAEINLPELK